jgi:3-keto-disaccharide hydrolase
MSNPRPTRWPVAPVAVVMLIVVAPASAADAANPNKIIHLFNGRDLNGWYVDTTETKYDNRGVFQVVDNMLYVPGGKDQIGYFGGLITRDAYENYRLCFEYKWGLHTVAVHSTRERERAESF